MEAFGGSGGLGIDEHMTENEQSSVRSSVFQTNRWHQKAAMQRPYGKARGHFGALPCVLLMGPLDCPGRREPSLCSHLTQTPLSPARHVAPSGALGMQCSVPKPSCLDPGLSACALIIRYVWRLLPVSTDPPSPSLGGGCSAPCQTSAPGMPFPPCNHPGRFLSSAGPRPPEVLGGF